MARLEVENSKSREDALMEVSRLQARAETAKRKATEASEEVVAARAIALPECQLSSKF